MRIKTGRDIYAERKRRGLTANRFCQLTGIDRTILRAMESGLCVPSQETIDKALALFELVDRKRRVAA